MIPHDHDPWQLSTPPGIPPQRPFVPRIVFLASDGQPVASCDLLPVVMPYESWHAEQTLFWATTPFDTRDLRAAVQALKPWNLACADACAVVTLYDPWGRGVQLKAVRERPQAFTAFLESELRHTMPAAWQEYSALLLEGKSLQAIAQEKGVSQRSVNQEVSRARRRYGETLFPKATARKAIRRKKTQ